jgi:hypothetical protein
MEHEQLVATWMSFMCTAIRKSCGLSGSQFIALAQKYRLISFLADNYELLHYYDNTYIINDVIRYISEQGGNLDDLSGIRWRRFFYQIPVNFFRIKTRVFIGTTYLKHTICL